MTGVTKLAERLRVEPFMVFILLTVGVAALLPARGSWAEGAGTACNLAIGLLFFLYGVRLSTTEAVNGLRHWRLHGTVLAATFLLFPLLGLAAQLLPGSLLPRDLALGVLFLCCLPSTVQSSIAFTSVAGGNVPAAICAASLSNLAGILVTPVLIGLLMATRGGISGHAVLDIAAQLLAPFVLGQLLRRWIGSWVTGHRGMLALVDRGSILLVVYTAFSDGMRAGIWHQVSASALGSLLLLNAVLLAIVLTATTALAHVLGFRRGDRITILFCGSKKSLASGLPMAGVLFAGHGVGLLVLPLMLFHQLQLMVCSWLAGRFARRAETTEAETSVPPAASPMAEQTAA
ncbi:MAG TPA: bile acid:sodium symporter family protein [Pseudonocardia sp.]|jgi:sodium/bile acid cotransporter 7|uniref:bile acid:sodium symporter family protein n=1 Tax=Pseudonocardia sp. TaxID=60912 RepID=UPI002F3F3A47